MNIGHFEKGAWIEDKIPGFDFKLPSKGFTPEQMRIAYDIGIKVLHEITSMNKKNHPEAASFLDKITKIQEERLYKCYIEPLENPQ